MQVGAICTPSTPAPARKSRRTNRDLRERLARCEALLKQHELSSSTIEPASASTSRSTDYAASMSDASQSPSQQLTPFADDERERELNPIWMPQGKVIVENGSVKYVDNFPWATIQNQVSVPSCTKCCISQNGITSILNIVPFPTGLTNLIHSFKLSISF